MLERMQMVPGFNDVVWKALLPSPRLPIYGSCVSPSVAIRPCLATPASSMKQEVVSSEVVRRALYSAALDFMSSGGHLQCHQPRLVQPQHHHHHHHHQQQQQQQQQVLLYGELAEHRPSAASFNYLHCQHHGSVTSRALIASPGGDLHEGIGYVTSYARFPLPELTARVNGPS